MIQFHFEEIENQDFTPLLITWLESILENEEKKKGEINYIFSDDEYVLAINKQYLQHDYYTDIITFDYVKGKKISGDIFVSLQRISDNAITLSKSYEEELRRVLAHGLLHLCGYDDKTPEDIAMMRSKEDYYLNLY